MQYRHTEFDESVNVTRSNPLSDFISYILAIFLLIASVYYFSVYAVELVIPYIDKKMESRIWGVLFDEHFSAKNKTRNEKTVEAEKYLQQLLDKIPKENLEGNDYQVILVEDDKINAMALPSGKIVVYTGLIKEIKSENALVFVLGHELGHFAHRDHLRVMGRGLIAGLLLSPFTDFGGANIIGSISSSFDTHFSREQELAADEYGLQSLNTIYGHAGGAIEFFDYVKENQKESLVTKYSSTHPVSEDRIENLKNIIRVKNIKERPVLAKKVQE